MTKTWFVTGASRGFGRSIATAALERGDRVAATARDASSLDELIATHGDAVLPLALDVTRKDDVDRTVQAAAEYFGSLDVVVNNAGYGLFGAVEEITDSQLRDQLETNLLGPLHVTQAALPIMRAQGSGHLVQVSTVGGVVSFPLLGGYHASKWALEGLTESLAQEVAGQGIKVTLVEPGAYATDWAGSSAVHAATDPVYDGVRAQFAEMAASSVPGDPAAVGAALLEVVDAEDTPLRVFLGTAGLAVVPAVYAARLEGWEAWRDLSTRAQG